MNYQVTYLIKRILSSVATTLIYVGIDNMMYQKQRNYYQPKSLKHRPKYQRKYYKLEDKESSMMRNKF